MSFLADSFARRDLALATSMYSILASETVLPQPANKVVKSVQRERQVAADSALGVECGVGFSVGLGIWEYSVTVPDSQGVQVCKRIVIFCWLRVGWLLRVRLEFPGR